MRVSADEADRAYDMDLIRKVRSVHLDGVLLTGCVTADDEAGYIKEFLPDPERPGHAMHDGVNWLFRERTGKVTITMKDTSRDWDKSRQGSARVQVGREPSSGDILVQVFSVVRPGAIKQMRMAFKDLPSGIDAKAQRAGIAAGAAAEMLGDQFGDTVDPSQAATIAIEQCTSMLLDEQSGKTRDLGDQAAG